MSGLCSDCALTLGIFSNSYKSLRCSSRFESMYSDRFISDSLSTPPSRSRMISRSPAPGTGKGAISARLTPGYTEEHSRDTIVDVNNDVPQHGIAMPQTDLDKLR